LKGTNTVLLIQMHGDMLTSSFGMWRLVKWTNINDMIVKLFTVVVACIKYISHFSLGPNPYSIS
jgi:hypothetical protein